MLWGREQDENSSAWLLPVHVRMDRPGAGAGRSDGAVRGAVAALSCPALATARISLQGVMDTEGRVDETRLRTHVFKNAGLLPHERSLLWRFLFGMYPCSSTALERPLLQEQLVVRYQVMKGKWQRLLSSAVNMHVNGTDVEFVAAIEYFNKRQAEVKHQSQEQSEEVQERLAFLQLQAQILLERVTLDREELQEAIRIIDKDVPRTNRDLSYYQGEGSGNLLVLRDILITYAAFHPEVSYAQGMNDLCSRFLEVLDSEVDTFWSFSCYMEKFSKDFRADGLHRKIELEAALLKELDPQLYNHLTTDNLESFTFCHRWLLLGFQREFEHSEALRLFEILSCDHLELVSQQVERVWYQERLAEKKISVRDSEENLQTINPDFTFELFICAAILLENRNFLLRCSNDVQLIQFATSLQGTLDLNSTLKKAEQLFFDYCKRCSWDYLKRRCTRPGNKEDLFYLLRNFFMLR